VSDEIKTIHDAIDAVQRDVKIVGKDATGHNHKYASYPQLTGLLRPVMRKYGLTISHRPTHLMDQGVILHAIRTVMVHRPSGEVIDEVWPVVVPNVKSVNEAQALGMGQTYGKRYWEVSVFALPVGDDADEARFNAAAEKTGDKDDTTAYDGLFTKDECLAELEKSSDFAAVARITKAHKQRSIDEGWDKDLANTYHARKDELGA